MYWPHLDQVSVLIAAGLMLQSFARRGLRLARSKSLPRLDLVAVALVAVALAARLATPPSLLHSNFHAYGIVAAILDFPNPSQYRASYGQTSFAVLGAIASLFGRNVDVVIRANTVLQTAALALVAALVGRAAGPWALRGALAAGALSPLMLRVAASEDAHNVAVAAGLLALLWADTWRRQGGDASDALGIVGALFLCVGARQGMLLWPGFVALTALRSARRPSRARLLALVGLSVALLIPLLVVRLHEPGDRISYVGYSLGPLLCQGPVFWQQHPLLNDPTVWPTLALAALATWFMGRRSVTALVLTLAAASTFVLTYAVSCAPMPREAAYQRLALFMLLAGLAGLGVGVLARCARLGPRGGLVAAAAIVLLLAVGAFRCPRLWRVVDPFYSEIALLHRHLRGRGPTTLVLPSAQGDGSRLGLTSQLIDAPNVRVVQDDEAAAATPGALRYEGLSCYATSLQSCEPPRWRSEFSSFGSSIRHLRRIFFELCAQGPSAPFFAECLPPSGVIPACRQRALRGTFEPWGSIEVSQDQLPVLYFSVRRVTLGVWREPTAVTP